MPRFREHFATAFAATLLIICILTFSLIMNDTTSVSAVEANGVGVYWDDNCINRVSSIDWGTLEPGLSKDITIYIRNEENEPIFLIMSTKNWNPPKASEYIRLEWDHAERRRVNLNETLRITLTLSISSNIEGISNFSFDIIVTGSDRLPGDANGDGRVSVLDVILVLINMGPVPPSPQECDMNCDGKVGVADMIIVQINFR